MLNFNFRNAQESHSTPSLDYAKRCSQHSVGKSSGHWPNSSLKIKRAVTHPFDSKYLIEQNYFVEEENFAFLFVVGKIKL